MQHRRLRRRDAYRHRHVHHSRRIAVKPLMLVSPLATTCCVTSAGCLLSECQTDAQCDDGLWCTGEEECEEFPLGNVCKSRSVPCCVEAEHDVPPDYWAPGVSYPALTTDARYPACSALTEKVCNEEEMRCDFLNECVFDNDCDSGDDGQLALCRSNTCVYYTLD